MKRLFYLLFGLVLLPALLYAQGSLSLKDINDNLTTNYYTKTASDARYATTTYGYSSAEVDILLAPKADKTYVNATDEAIISDNDSQDVQIESNRVAIMLKASQTDMDSAENAIQLILADDDSQDVTIEANKVGVASLEVGLQTHQNNPTGAHAATAISATWTNVQVSLDSIEAAIQSIVIGSGFATQAWVNSTLETNFYTKAQTESTVAVMIKDNAQAKYWYPANMANGDYTGEIIISTMSASQTQYNVVYMKSDGWEAAKADASTTIPAMGIALETGTGSKKVLMRGLVKNTSWSFTRGQKIYVSAATAGAITATAPNTAGQYVQIVGIAVAADTVYFFFDSTYVKN